MQDLISRREAIDAIVDCTVYGNADDLKEAVMQENAWNKWSGGVLEALEAVEELPSVTPKCPECDDAVSREAAIDAALSAFSRGLLASPDIRKLPSVTPKPQWIPVSERLPEEDHWLGGSGKQFSGNVLISILNSDDEDEWVDVSYTIDGEWTLELPRYCKITAWKPLPEPYRGDGNE